MASIFCCEYLEVEDIIFELVGVLVEEAAAAVPKDCPEEAATGVEVSDKVVLEGVEMEWMGLDILVGSRTGMIRLKCLKVRYLIK